MPPENTSCDMTATTSSGMNCSFDLATADNASLSIAEATQVKATSANSFRPGLPNTTAPWVGPPLPISSRSRAGTPRMREKPGLAAR